MKDIFIKACDWAQINWLMIVISLTIMWTGILFIIAISWIVAFWLNGLYGFKFELGSCWQGVTVVATALGSILALAKAGWTKYETDSKHNSIPYEDPYKKGE